MNHISAEFDEAFSSFDKDGGGQIDTSDLGALMQALGEKITEEELSDIIKDFDPDGCHFILVIYFFLNYGY